MLKMLVVYHSLNTGTSYIYMYLIIIVWKSYIQIGAVVKTTICSCVCVCVCGLSDTIKKYLHTYLDENVLSEYAVRIVTYVQQLMWDPKLVSNRW